MIAASITTATTTVTATTATSIATATATTVTVTVAATITAALTASDMGSVSLSVSVSVSISRFLPFLQHFPINFSPLSPTSLRSIIKNPGDSEYLEVIAAGEAATWPFISRIKAHCYVEMTLDK